MPNRLGYDPGTFVDTSSTVPVDATLMNAIKNALNTNSFDADTVSGFGILSSNAAKRNLSDAPYNKDFNNAIDFGFYFIGDAGLLNGPGSSYEGFMLVYGNNPTTSMSQWLFPANNAGTYPPYFRYRYNSGWGQWQQNWTSANDGNSGQPPAPKPRNTTAASIGFVGTQDFSGTTPQAIGPSDGGSWYIETATLGTTFSGGGLPVGSTAGVVAGGATITPSASLRMLIRRIA